MHLHVAKGKDDTVTDAFLLSLSFIGNGMEHGLLCPFLYCLCAHNGSEGCYGIYSPAQVQVLLVPIVLSLASNDSSFA